MPFKRRGFHNINKVQLPITNICNRRCPHCSAKSRLTWYDKSLSPTEISLDELAKIGKLFGKLKHIEITGGEPTTHSKFEEISNNLTNYFQYDNVWLLTNGWLFGQDPSKLKLLLNYQTVWFSHYTQQFAKKYNTESNTHIHALISKFTSDNGIKLIDNTFNEHWPSDSIGGHPCNRIEANLIAYYGEYLYGCCMTWTKEFEGKGIPLTSDWREHLDEMELPCETCMYLIRETSFPPWSENE